MKSPRVLAVIPARLGSTRFPNKVTHLFRNQPLLNWVYRDILRCRMIDRVVIATDNLDIKQTMTALGAEVIMTGKRHKSGSDRVAEAAQEIGGEIIINVQADNFGLSSQVLGRVIKKMQQDKSFQYATLARKIDSDVELNNPNTVKVVIAKDSRALWFSRLPLPCLHHTNGRSPIQQHRYLAHIGVYFFRRKALDNFATWPQTMNEKVESLEQLRILEHGENMHVFLTSLKTVSVESPQDVKKLQQIYTER